MHHPTAGFLPSSRLQFPSYLPAMRPMSSDSPAQLVSPLVTPNSSFETLRNFSPPLPAPPSNQYAQYMPMQHQKEHIFPLLFRVAMDVLPTQASKETCTDRHANLSPTVLEALQVLKFSYKQDQLNFTSHLIAEEVDHSISGPVSRNAIDELMAACKLDELAQLLANENEDDFST
ncbi:hypothetical protein EDB19DRAFT_1803506 [Suillus lakei]|nr:hypothetical protein EDB19DRAFT_1803506 [Suillus lakei]